MKIYVANFSVDVVVVVCEDKRRKKDGVKIERRRK
jgi:hypothetical protein